MFTYLILSALIFTPIFVTLYFRKFLHEHPEADVEAIEGAYTRAILSTLGGLLLGVLTPHTELTQSLTIANFALTLMAIVWMQIDYARAMDRHRARVREIPLETTPPAALFTQSVRGLAFILCLYAVLHYFSLAGFLLFFYATPVLARVMFASLPMHESPLRERIRGVFTEAGVEVGHIRIIQSRRKGFANAMVCGTKWGFGPFRRTLFITESLFERLEEEEFVAVMRHEAAHFRLHHLRERVLTVIGTYLLSIVLTMVPVFAFVALLMRLQWRQPQLEAIVSVGAALAGLYWINRITFAMIHRQEHEADLEAVRMGSPADAMISALRKITDDHGGSNRRQKSFLRRLILSHAHPSLDEREAVLRAGEAPRAPYFPFPAVRLVATYAALIACTTWLVMTQPRGRADRSVASESPRPADISR